MPSNKPRKRSKALQALAQAWKDRIEKWLIDHGAAKDEQQYAMYDHRIMTVVGWLQIRVDIDPWPTVFCRFEDPARASPPPEKKFYHIAGQVNPHSGKWNWHFDDSHLSDGKDGQPNTADVGFLLPLERILPEKTEPTFEVGQRVQYPSKHDTMIGGILAELTTTPLTKQKMGRVVDFHHERKDPEAGRWVPVSQLKELS